MDLFWLLFDLGLVQKHYFEIVQEGYGALMTLPKKKREKEIKKFKKMTEKAQCVEGCFDWISHVENVYEKLEEFFKK